MSHKAVPLAADSPPVVQFCVTTAATDVTLSSLEQVKSFPRQRREKGDGLSF
jgi:hypothetical protein